jgi:hypothetical protein
LKIFVKKSKKDQVQYAKKLPKSIRLDIEEKTVDRKLSVRNTATAALNNLETVLSLIDGGKLKVSAKTGRPTLASQKNLGRLLQEGDWYEEGDILEDVGHIQAFAWAGFCGPNPGEIRPISIPWSPGIRWSRNFALKRQLFLCEQGYEYAIQI